MAKETGIEWADHTFNPWWGCEKVSPACRDCYAETWADRFPKTRGLWGPGAPRKIASEATWKEPMAWFWAARRAGVQRRVFCASMSDVFEDRPDLVDARARLAELVTETVAHGAGPGLIWMFLTKRPGNIVRLLSGTKLEPVVDWGLSRSSLPDEQVWCGATFEDEARYAERMPELSKVRARVTFGSCEPLLGPVDLWFDRRVGTPDWIIAGGESGEDASARPMFPDWARSIRNQCV
jgi:protein gp37